MEKYIMALDAGTTSNRSIIFNKNGEILSVAQKEFSQIYPQPGWVEHDAEEIWCTMLGVAAEALAKAGIGINQIAAVGITNQRETTIVWDKTTGKPVYNAIVWQCRRTAKFCDTIADKKDMIYRKTGLVLDPYFSGTKIRWILDNVPGAREKAENGELLFGTVETWLLYKLSGGKVHVTDYSNASRTMLFNINNLTWDKELLKLLDIPAAMLPEVKSNSEIYGVTDKKICGAEVPVAGMAGDQQSSLFGQTCFEKGEAKNTYGTGCFLLTNAGEKPVFSEDGLITTIGWSINGKTTYALEGSVFMGGAVVKWLRDEMCLISKGSETEEAAKAVEDTNGCFLVPAFTGLGAPYWDPYARGVLVGLTRGVNKNHVIRAALDSIAYQVNDVLGAMASTLGKPIEMLNVDGGASANNYLMQFQSDISSVSAVRPENVETTALGAAYLAGLAVGYWEDFDDIRANRKVDTVFRPNMDDEKRADLTASWKKAVERAKNWAED